MKAVNDNDLPPEWYEFYNSECYKYWVRRDHDFVHKIKTYGWNGKDNRWRGMCNLIWFARFERTFAIEEGKKNIKVVK